MNRNIVFVILTLTMCLKLPIVGADQELFAGNKIRSLEVTNWAPIGFQTDNILWIGDFHGLLKCSPVYVKDLNSLSPKDGFRSFDHTDFGRVSIPSDQIRQIQMLIPEYKEHEYMQTYFKITLKNRVFFFASVILHRVDFNSTKDGNSVRIKYEWPKKRYKKEELVGLISSITFGAKKADPINISYVGGRKEKGTNWQLISGSYKNWYPRTSNITVFKDDAELKIPVADVSGITMSSSWGNPSTLHLKSAKELKGNIGAGMTDGTSLGWNGRLDSIGKGVNVQFPYGLLSSIELNSQTNNLTKVNFRVGHHVFFQP